MNAAALESSTNKPPKRKRRWFQFSLRTLMLMMLVFGCGLGWLAYEWTRNAKGRADIVAIRNFGGKVSFDDEKLLENTRVLINAVLKAKPTTAKGRYLKKINLAATMSPGVLLDELAYV